MPSSNYAIVVSALSRPIDGSRGSVERVTDELKVDNGLIMRDTRAEAFPFFGNNDNNRRPRIIAPGSCEKNHERKVRQIRKAPPRDFDTLSQRK